MKKLFRTHRMVAILLSVIAILGIVGGGVFAATGGFQPTNMISSSGSVTIVAKTVTPDYNYTLGATVLNFGTTTTVEAEGQFVATSQSVTITNTGNMPIHGIHVAVATYPTGFSNPQLNIACNLNPDGSGGTFTISICGTAPSSTGTIDLSGLSCSITPYE